MSASALEQDWDGVPHGKIDWSGFPEGAAVPSTASHAGYLEDSSGYLSGMRLGVAGDLASDDDPE